MCLYWKEMKFVSTFLTINFDDERVFYKDGKTGYIINFEYRLLVDEHIIEAEEENGEDEEVFELIHIANAFKEIAVVDASIYDKTIEIFIEQEFLKLNAEGETVQDKINNYLELLGLEEEISLTYEEKNETFYLNNVFVPCYALNLNILNNASN